MNVAFHHNQYKLLLRTFWQTNKEQIIKLHKHTNKHTHTKIMNTCNVPNTSKGMKGRQEKQLQEKTTIKASLWLSFLCGNFNILDILFKNKIFHTWFIYILLTLILASFNILIVVCCVCFFIFLSDPWFQWMHKQ